MSKAKATKKPQPRVKLTPEQLRRQKAVQAIRDSIAKSVAAGLTAAVEANPVSVPALADETLLPTMNVYRIFKGENEPGLTTVVILARRFGVSIDSLVNGTAPKKKAKAKSKA